MACKSKKAGTEYHQGTQRKRGSRQNAAKGCSMNQDVLEGKWKQLHGLAKTKWGKLTDDELDQTKGNYEILVGKIQEKYGTTREEIERELHTLLAHKPAPKPR